MQKEYNRLSPAKGYMTPATDVNTVRRFTSGKKINIYLKKENIYTEGNYPNGIYYINYGKVKIYKTNTTGKDFIMTTLKEGDFFGFTSMLEDRAYTESAQAMEKTELTFISKEEFFRLLAQNPDAIKIFLHILTENVTEQSKKLLELAYSPVRKRVADVLLTLNEQYKNEKHPNVLTVSREDLANMAGTATESLIRTLSDFREEHLIETKGGRIHILDENKLKAIKY
jgi:CRP/FNR family transcriptional regulator, polysaccharide utilization system transcription regulator